MRIAVKFAYDGRNYYGYARQPQLKTVEGKIINSLIKNSYIEDIKEASIRSASRTDKGVSALCNVLTFNTSKFDKNILKNLSKNFNDIIFYAIKRVDCDFNPRYAKQRIYRYYLKKNSYDIDLIIKTASFFTGEHDFTNFARVEDNKNPVRNIDNIVLTEHENYLIIDFYAQTFLWHQIRRIISALEKVANNKLKAEQILDSLNKPYEKVDFGLAPAGFLILKNIIYDFDFEYDKGLFQKAENLIKNFCNNNL